MMIFKKIYPLVGAAVLLFNYNLSYACTTVFFNNNNQAIAARTMDLYISDQPKIIINPRGMSRSGEAGENSLNWKSKYGNVVVTAFNSNAVSDGLNEQGLAVHLLYLSGTDYPKRDYQLPAISNALWGQYILDNFKTVKEALNSTKKLQIVAMKIANQKWPLHLTMEDASGDSAVIEFTNGQMQYYHGKQYRVMTNEPSYTNQLENLKKYVSFGGSLPLPGDADPMSRFVRASTYLGTLPAPKDSPQAIASTISVIRNVMVPFGAVDLSGEKTTDAWPTRWVSIADMTNKVFYFSSTNSPNTFWLDFSKLKFAPNSPVLSIDPNDIDLEGNVSPKVKS